MGFELEPGDVCTVQRLFKLDGQVAFNMGDEVRIDAISVDPQRPGFKYMAFSKPLNKYVRLRGVDLERKYCPMCNHILDPTEFKCEACGWVFPGREQEQRAEDWEDFQEKQREARREADRHTGDTW